MAPTPKPHGGSACPWLPSGRAAAGCDPSRLRRRRDQAQRRPPACRPGAGGPTVGRSADRRTRLTGQFTGQPPRQIAGGRRGAGRHHRQVRQIGRRGGLEPMRGAGLVVTLNDAQRDAEGRFPRDASPDDLVVHQQDIDAVLNALWSAGAEGIQMQDQRIIGTSAPRCIGNTLLLNGRTYSPPTSSPRSATRLPCRPPSPRRRWSRSTGSTWCGSGWATPSSPERRWIWPGIPGRCACSSPSPQDPSAI